MAMSLSGALATFQNDVQTALEDGYNDMIGPQRTDMDEMRASIFASRCTPILCSAILTLAQNMKISGNNSNTSTILGQNYIASPAGPIPGAPVPGVGVVSLSGVELNAI